MQAWEAPQRPGPFQQNTEIEESIAQDIEKIYDAKRPPIRKGDDK